MTMLDTYTSPLLKPFPYLRLPPITEALAPVAAGGGGAFAELGGLLVSK